PFAAQDIGQELGRLPLVAGRIGGSDAKVGLQPARGLGENGRPGDRRRRRDARPQGDEKEEENQRAPEHEPTLSAVPSPWRLRLGSITKRAPLGAPSRNPAAAGRSATSGATARRSRRPR